MDSKISDSKKEELVNFAKLAEQCERYDDMVKFVKQLVDIVNDLNEDQRNLFSVAFKNKTSSRRTAWRAISAFEEKEQNKNSRSMETIKSYKTKIQKQLIELCNDVITTINSKLIKKSTKTEAKIFYLKMRADYYRYLCEVSKSETLKQTQENALKTYTEALELAEKENIPKTSPLKLGIFLNFSVFYYEIISDIKKAIEICEKGFKESSNCLSDIGDEEFKDATTIMQIMYDNMTSWKAETQP